MHSKKQDFTGLFKFVPLKFAWAAIHPNPVGTVYFIGGAFFGTFPTLFYRFLLKNIFLQGYTVVALPFRFSFRHWSIAIGLAENQATIRQGLLEAARQRGYGTEAYQIEPGDRPQTIKEYWLGHSLGCKYIALLELLTDYEQLKQQTALKACIGAPQALQIEQLLATSSLASVSLYNQPSVLLDPVIADLENAVPIKALQRLVERLIQVRPSRQETFCLIDKTRLFALTTLISFESQLARASVLKLQQLLADRLLKTQSIAVGQPLLGKHLAVLGVKTGNPDIVAAVLQDLATAGQQDVTAPCPALAATGSH